MKDTFQAKDIQNILVIPKHRYEYIASKIGIQPEVDEVEGTGRTHLYSFKNLLQFAFVHQANKMGFTPKAARKILSYIDAFELSEKYGIYDQTNINKLRIHYIDNFALEYFVFNESGKTWIRIFPEESFENLENKFPENVAEVGLDKVKKACIELTEFLEKDREWMFQNALAIVTLNLGIIKKAVLIRSRKLS